MQVKLSKVVDVQRYTGVDDRISELSVQAAWSLGSLETYEFLEYYNIHLIQ